MTDAVYIDDATLILGGRAVLKGVSLRLRGDEHACILGPNGSGKSSLVRMIAGELSPLYREPSSIRLFGQERWELFALRAKLGIVSDRLQAEQARGESVLEMILSGFYGSVGLPLYAEPEPELTTKAIEAAELLGVRGLLQRRAASLSSGEQRRVLVARALVHEPEMLLLDEPFASLDIASRHAFGLCVRGLAQRGHAIILVTHELSEIPPEIERVVLVKDGCIVADGEKRSILNSETISGLYGIPIEVTESGGHFHARPRER